MSPEHRAGTKVPASLLPMGVERAFAADEIIYLTGQVAETMYLILEGRVRLIRERGGRPVLIHEETAGGALGEVPLFEGGTYPATAVAAERTRCLAIPRDALVDALRRDPDLALSVLARFASRIRTLVERLDRTSTQSVLARLAELILERSHGAEGKAFTLGRSQQEAAEEIGTVRELVVRGVKTLRERGVIESRGGGRFMVLDVAQLRHIAQGE